jgi:hypothetical protein
MHLAVLGLHQYGSTMTAGIVDRVIAGIEDRRCANDGAYPALAQLLESFAMVGHCPSPNRM